MIQVVFISGGHFLWLISFAYFFVISTKTRKNDTNICYMHICIQETPACADPESFVRGGPTILTTFFFNYFLKIFLADKGREDPITTESGPSSAHQRNAIEMAFRWRADGGLN